MGLKFKNLSAIFFLFLAFSVHGQAVNDQVNAELFLTSPNLPFDSTASADDITSTYFNPAGIGIHPLQIGLFYANDKTDKLNDYLVFLNLFGFAFSGQWRESDSGFNAQRLSIGTGIETGKILSIGTTYNWYHSSSPILNNYAEWDIGIIFRPLRYLSMGAVARGLNLPVFQNVQIKPRFDAGISIRPLPVYTENLTLSADATFYIDNRANNIIPRFTIEAVPYNGITFYGGVTLPQTFNKIQDIYFGLKFAQNITQLSFQGSKPAGLDWFFGGGVVVGQERFQTNFEALKYYLEIPLDTAYPESKKSTLFFLEESPSFYELLSAIEEAATDPQINGIVIRANNFHGGWGQAEEIRNALLRFQEVSAKPVLAFISSGSNKDYFIATGAQKIIMPPAGILELTGLKAEVYYLRGLFDLLGVEPEFLAVGEYKSAPNTYTKKGPDKFEKEQMLELLTSIQNDYKKAILSKRKNFSASDLEAIFNEGIYTVTSAKEKGLIDDVMYFPEIKEKYLKVTSSLIPWKIDLQAYLKNKIYDDHWGLKPAVAVLTLEGEITEAKQSIPFINVSENINLTETIKMLEKIRANPIIRAVVIRINSPGGSGLASDILWEEIRLVQKEKPVVVSIGDVAASGGYYLASGADEILANQTSVTGSIGVFFGKFSLKGLYKKLGVEKETFKLNDKGDIFSEANTFSEDEKKVLNAQIREFYELFLNRVQRSRTNLTMDEIKENARGRVYTGNDAKKRGMVDKVGGLSLALEIAREKGKLDERYMQVMLFPGNGENILEKAKLPVTLPAEIKSTIKILNDAQKIGSENEILLLMPYDYTVK